MSNAKQKHVCFVVNELYPIHKGGIGRWIYNTLNRSAGQGTEFTLLLYGPQFHDLEPAKLEKCQEAFAGIAHMEVLSDVLRREGSEYAVTYTGTFDEFASESMYLHAGLKQLHHEGKVFDYIEFIDFGGPGFFTVQGKKGEAWLQETTVAVRLHSTNSLIVEHEIFDVQYSAWHSELHDIERKTLLDADLIVGHIEAIAKINQEYYKFPETWLDNVVIDVPPVLLDAAEAADRKTDVKADDLPVFAFTSRLASFKRPDLFVAAASIFLDRGGKAKFVLASYGWDGRYIDRLKAAVPRKYADAILFLEDLPEQERLRITRNAIVVVPSIYESFCFLAFETVLRRQRLILNKACAAFGGFSFWQDGRNCRMFAGNAVSLADVMADSLSWQPDSFDMPAETEPYWTRHSAKPVPPVVGAKAGLRVVHFGSAAAAKVIAPFARGEQSFDISVVSIESSWRDGRRIREAAAGAPFVTFVTPGMMHDAPFLKFAHRVLEAYPEYDGVVPQLQDLSGRFGGGLSGGDLVTNAITHVAKIGIFGTIMRAELLDAPDIWIDDGEEWLHSGLSRAVLKGHRFAASPEGACRLFTRHADRILTPEMASGIYKQNLPLYVGTYGASPGQLIYNQQLDEKSLYVDLRRHIDNAEQMARERYAAMQHMEAMIISRDRHIESDGKLLRERFDVIQRMAEELKAKDTQIALRDKAIATKNEQIAAAEALAHDRLGEIDALKARKILDILRSKR